MSTYHDLSKPVETAPFFEKAMTTAREVYLHLIATDPRFRLAPERGNGVVIVGAEPGPGKSMSVSQTSFQNGAALDDGELT